MENYDKAQQFLKETIEHVPGFKDEQRALVAIGYALLALVDAIYETERWKYQ